MKKIKTIFDREFESCFRTFYGYILTAFLLLVAGIYVSVNAFRNTLASFETSVSNMTFIYLIAIPVLTMRVYSEERRQKTEQLLYSLPVKMSQAAIGKFLALCAALTVPVAVMAIYPLVMGLFGTVDLKAAYCALFGFWLLGCSLCAVGMFTSSLSDNQAVSACLSFIIILLLFFLKTLSDLLPPAAAFLANIFRSLSPFDRYYSFLSGIFDIRSLLYMLAFSCFFLVLTVMVTEGRRREKKGLYYSLVIALTLAVIALGDTLVSRLPQKFTQLEMNNARITEFSAETEHMAQKLNSDVNIYWITRDGREDGNIRQTLSRFAELSDKIHVVKIDPVKQPRFAYKYTNRTVNENSLVVECGTASRYIDFTEIYRYPDEKNPHSAEYNAEGLIAGAIQYAVGTEEINLYILSGHGEEKLSDSFIEPFKNSNMNVAALDLLTAGEIPDNCSCLLVTSTPADLTDSEAGEIIGYLENGGRLILFSTYLDEKTPNWNAVLARYGLGAQKGVIIEGNSNYVVANYPYYLLPDIKSHAITDPLLEAGQRVIVPLTQAAAVDSVIPEDVDFTALLVTSNAAYAKADGFDMKTTVREEGDISGQFVIAAAVTKDEGERSSALVWVPTAYMLAESVNKSVSGGNMQFLKNAVSFLTGSEGGSAAQPKHIGGGRLTVPSDTANLLSTLMIAVIPLCIALYGIVVIVGRKRR